MDSLDKPKITVFAFVNCAFKSLKSCPSVVHPGVLYRRQRQMCIRDSLRSERLIVLFPVHSPLNIGALLFILGIGISPPSETFYNV